MRIYAQNGGSLTRQERLDLATLLVKAGYTVSAKKVKINGKSVDVVEYNAMPQAVEDSGPYKEGEHGASE